MGRPRAYKGGWGRQKPKLRCNRLKLIQPDLDQNSAGTDSLVHIGLTVRWGWTLRFIWAGQSSPARNFEVSGWCPVSVRFGVLAVHASGPLRGVGQSGWIG